MNEKETARYEESMVEYLKARVSRAQLLKAAGAGLAIAAIPGTAAADSGGGGSTGQTFPFFPTVTGTYTTEAIQDILNIAVTAEHLAVTLLTAVVSPGSPIASSLNALFKVVLQAALVEEQYHLDFLSAVGAKPLTTTFTVPNPKILTDVPTLFGTLEAAETVFVAAYMTAAREFAELGQPTLAKYAYQIGAVEAEHRALARGALATLGAQSDIPPNNKAYETDLFLYVRDAATLLVQLGFIGGSGTPASYPGRAAALAAAGPLVAAVVQRSPNNATSSVTAASNLTGARDEPFLTALLLGGNETGGGDPNGSGIAIVTLKPDQGLVCFQLNVTGIQLPAAASHIHRGAAGIAGPVVIPFIAPDASGSASGCTSADPALIRDVQANPSNYYVNVHTGAFPAGAIRGQLG